MAPPPSRYGPLHALAAGAVLVFAVLSNGFAAFWRQFLHGLDIRLDEKTVLPLLGWNAFFFGGLLVALWLTTVFRRRTGGRVSSRTAAMRFALVATAPICLAALGINWACGELLARFAELDLSDQALVKAVTENAFSTGGKTMLFAFLLLEAPLLEEPLFRGVVFGGLSKAMPVWMAATVSGFLFALIHVNAATLIPLWFLGVAFAWLYARTGTLLAPMSVHFAFNAINLILCLVF